MSRGDPGGWGRAGPAGRRPREPRAAGGGGGEGRAGGALEARRGDARLPLVRKTEPGTRGGGWRSCRRLRGSVAAPLPAAAALPPVPGSGPGGGREREGPREARVVVTGDGEGGARRPEGVRVRGSGRETEAGAKPVAREGGGAATGAEPSCAGANSRRAGVGGARSRQRRLAPPSFASWGGAGAGLAGKAAEAAEAPEELRVGPARAAQTWNREVGEESK